MGVAKKFWPILAIFLLVAAFAYPYWAQGLVPFNSTYLVTWFAPWNAYFGMPVKNGSLPDVISQIYPWRNLVIESFRLGQWPLWNPYSFSGTPLLANFQSAVFHPLNFLFFLLPQIDAWSVIVLCQPLLAALFTYLFCRQIKISRAGSLLAGIAFGFCGFLVVWLPYGIMGFALLWLPLALWAIEKRSSPWSGLVLSLALAFSVFSGHFQTSLYVALASLAYLIFRRAWRLLLFWILGLTLAAPQILPTMEFYQQSVRSGLFVKGEIIPWQYLVTLFAPDFYGNPVTRNDWFGHYAEWAGFIGVIPLVLAMWAAVRHRSPSVWFFIFLGLGALVLALPTPFLDLLVKLKVPVLATSAAARIIGLFSFGAAVLAGFGLDQLVADWAVRKNLKKMVLFGSGLGFLFFGIWLALLVWRPFPDQWLLVAKRNFILPTLMLAALGAIFWLGFRLKNKGRLLLMLAILLLAGFDLFRFAFKWLPFDPREDVYPRLPVIDFLAQKTNGLDRVFGNFGSEAAVYFHLPGVEGYDPLYIRRYGEFISAAGDGKIGPLSRSTVYLNKNGAYTDKILSLLGVKYLLHTVADGRNVWAYPFWQSPQQYRRVYQDEKHEVWENAKALPRAFLVSDFKVVKEDQAIMDTLLAANFDMGTTVVLEEDPGISLAPWPAAAKDAAKIITYSPAKIEIETKAPGPSLLFLSDNDYPGWQALVDGQKVKVYRADYTFRAVSLPAGEHQVVFVYRPEAFGLGQKIAGVSLGMILVLTIWLKFSGRRR